MNLGKIIMKFKMKILISLNLISANNLNSYKVLKKRNYNYKRN